MNAVFDVHLFYLVSTKKCTSFFIDKTGIFYYHINVNMNLFIKGEIL